MKKLIGSASTLAALIELMEKRCYWSTEFIQSIVAGNNPDFQIIQKNNRFRLERQ